MKMTLESIDRFEKIQAQLQSLYEEIGVLSQKRPGDALNKFKLSFLNSIIEEVNRFLPEEYIPFSSFEGFEEDALPSNSDAVFIISQYLGCLEKLRADNIMHYGGEWYWRTGGTRTEVRTGPPKKIKK